MLTLVLLAWMLPMDHWYSGPLSERLISVPQRVWSNWQFNPVGPDAGRIRDLSARLLDTPIHVLAPDNPYAGYGLQAGRDDSVLLVHFNWLVYDAAVRAGGNMDFEIWAGVVPPPHEALEWALAALRSMGIEPDIEWEPGFPEHSREWETQIAHDAQDPEPYDPSVVRHVLEELGAQVPADLAMVPLPLPPPPVEEPKPKTKAEMRAIFQRLGIPVPAQYADDTTR